MRIDQGFQQAVPQEGHPFTDDPVLPGLIKRLLPHRIHEQVHPDLVRLGHDIQTVIRAASARTAPPTLTQYDQWGRRVDNLQTSEGWRELKAISQKEGLPGIFYERKFKEHSRVYGFTKAIMLVGDTQSIFCPISMTDGTARVLELSGTAAMKRHVYPRLISRDPSYAFTSGQWMTERPGGSDVSQTETGAHYVNKTNPLGPHYLLDGFKWFSSATDSDVSVALARTGSKQAGSRGLSLFLIPMRLPLLRQPSDPIPAPISNNIYVHRLKNKIGTHTLPTAELSLEFTQGYLIGKENQGVKTITPVLNITRVWSAISSVGNLRKCLAVATKYAEGRKVNGGRTLLKDTPLHVSHLASINLLYRALVHLTFGTIHLLGKDECGVAQPGEKLRLRLMTPIAKAFAEEKACTAMEDAMTTLGGAGYMEENGFGGAIRDALVEKIWEGTTTVLSLDLVRVAQKEPTAIQEFHLWAKTVVSSCPSELQEALRDSFAILDTGLSAFLAAFQAPIHPLIPRHALMLSGYIASSIFLLEQAIWSYTTNQPQQPVDLEVFIRWVNEGGMSISIADVQRTKSTPPASRIALDSQIAFGNIPRSKL